MRRLIPTLLCAAALLVPASCGGGGGGDDGAASGGSCPIGALDDATGTVTVKLWHWFAGLPNTTLQQQAKAFNASQRKVKIVLQGQGDPNAMQAKLDAGAIDRDLPGLVTLDVNKLQWAKDSGLFDPAQTCTDAHPDLKRTYADLLPYARSTQTIDGDLYPVSFSMFTTVLFYNRDHFKAAGLDPDSPPKTFEEVAAAARKIKAAMPDTKPLALVAQPWITEMILTGAGQPTVNNDNGRTGRATESTLRSPSAVKLLELLQDMKADGLADIIPGSPGQVDHVLAMAQQQSSMTIESSAASSTVAGVLEGTLDAQRLQEELGVELPAGAENLTLDLDMDVAAPPGIDAPGRAQVAGSAWYIPNTNSPEVQAGAWEFVRFLNRPANQAAWAAQGSVLPAFAGVAEAPEVTEAWSASLGGTWQQRAYEAVASGVDPDFPGPLIGPYTESRTALRGALDDALLDGTDPAKALDDADQAMDEQLETYNQDVGG